jgi:hypothetical protein
VSFKVSGAVEGEDCFVVVERGDYGFWGEGARDWGGDVEVVLRGHCGAARGIRSARGSRVCKKTRGTNAAWGLSSQCPDVSRGGGSGYD